MDPRRAAEETTQWQLVAKELDVGFETLAMSLVRAIDYDNYQVITDLHADVTPGIRGVLMDSEEYIRNPMRGTSTLFGEDALCATLMLELINRYKKSAGKKSVPPPIQAMAAIILAKPGVFPLPTAYDYDAAGFISYNDVKLQSIIASGGPPDAYDAVATAARPEVETRKMLKAVEVAQAMAALEQTTLDNIDDVQSEAGTFTDEWAIDSAGNAST